MADPDTHLVALICDSLRAEFAPRFDELHRFVDRRIAELSAEVHGTAQLLDFSETNLSGQLSRIHEQINSVVSQPALASRSSGMELESVVQDTETAANQIMEAAEVIGDWVHSENRDPAALPLVAEKVNIIFEACTFQDITGQRVRRAIEHLKRVETMLSDIMPTASPVAEPAPMPTQEAAVAEMAQGDVDRLFD